MSGGIINMKSHCRACTAPLTLDEMHYLDNGDGTATCSDCEKQWTVAMSEWRANDGKPMPKRP